MADDENDGKCEAERWVDSVKEIVRDFVSPPTGPSGYTKSTDEDGYTVWTKNDD